MLSNAQGASNPEAPAASGAQATNRRGRPNKTNVTGYFSQGVKRQLRQLALDEDTTIQLLLTEALNDLFAKRGLPEIAGGD